MQGKSSKVMILEHKVSRDVKSRIAHFRYTDFDPAAYHFTLDMTTRPGSPKMVIQHESFAEVFSKYKFYPVLRHVALPPLEIKPLSSSTSATKKGEYKYKYSDQLLFFEWLQIKMGVKEIFRVIVDDTKTPHRDEEIIDVLAGKGTRGRARLQSFDVEILDWRKMDLCPVVVQSAAPNLRELHLRWSGSNAVLRGWSEPEGLPKLEHLRTIHLHYTVEKKGVLAGNSISLDAISLDAVKSSRSSHKHVLIFA